MRKSYGVKKDGLKRLGRCKTIFLQVHNTCKMPEIEISEIHANLLTKYKAFMREGFIKDEENFGITPADDAHASFPTESTEDSFTLAAYSGDNLAGVVSFSRAGKDREKLRHKGELFRMYVHRKYRGKGISNLLIEHLLERVRQLKDIEQINLFVIAENTLAKRVYEKYGFKTYGIEPCSIKWKDKYFAKELMVLMLGRD